MFSRAKLIYVSQFYQLILVYHRYIAISILYLLSNILSVSELFLTEHIVDIGVGIGSINPVSIRF